MANLSTLIGGGVKSVVRYHFTDTQTNTNSNWSQTVSITAVADMAKTSLNLLSPSIGASTNPANLVGIKLTDVDEVTYVIESSQAVYEDLVFEVIEYY